MILFHGESDVLLFGTIPPYDQTIASELSFISDLCLRQIWACGQTYLNVSLKFSEDTPIIIFNLGTLCMSPSDSFTSSIDRMKSSG